MNLLVFLLSIVYLNIKLSKGSPISLDQRNATAEDSSTEEDPAFEVSTLPFAHFLSNPCTYTPPTRHQRIMEGQRRRYAEEFYKYLVNYATWYRRDTESILNEYALGDCLLLGLDVVPHTPTFQQLIDMDTGDAINKIHYSLLMHSAYVYFMHHQYQGREQICPMSVSDQQLLAAQALGLANKQKSLVCTIQTSMSILGYTLNSTDSILDHQITDLSMCSRMAIRDCQVLRSIIHLLKVVENYARAQL